jgi:hypothetical protein
MCPTDRDVSRQNGLISSPSVLHYSVFRASESYVTAMRFSLDFRVSRTLIECLQDAGMEYRSMFISWLLFLLKAMTIYTCFRAVKYPVHFILISIPEPSQAVSLLFANVSFTVI